MAELVGEPNLPNVEAEKEKLSRHRDEIPADKVSCALDQALPELLDAYGRVLPIWKLLHWAVTGAASVDLAAQVAQLAGKFTNGATIAGRSAQMNSRK